MHKSFVLFLGFMFFGIFLYAQQAPYPIVKHIKIDLVQRDGDCLYNGKRIEWVTCDSIRKSNAYIDKCRPCHLMTYSQKGVLLEEGDFYTDCPIGELIYYYESGKPMLIEHFEENRAPYYESYEECSFLQGDFFRLSEKGDTVFHEIYNQDTLVYTSLKPNEPFLYKVNLQIGGEKIPKDTILSAPDLNRIQMVLHYKGPTPKDEFLKLKFIIRNYENDSYKTFEGELVKQLSFSEVSGFDFLNWLRTAGFTKADTFLVQINLIQNKEVFRNFWIKVNDQNLPDPVYYFVRKNFETPKVDSSLMELDHDFILVNSMDTSKSVLLDRNGAYRLHVNIKTIDSVYTYSNADYDGKITYLFPESFNMEIKNEYHRAQLANGIYLTQDFSYSDLPNGILRRNIPLYTLASIDYSSKKQENMNMIGSMFGMVGLSALLLSPIVSLPHGDKEFNKQRFHNWAITGAIGIGVCIPLLILSQDKTYPIQEKGMKPSFNTWYLEKRLRE